MPSTARRLLLAASLCLLAPAGAWAQRGDAALPQRNLLIEVRQGDEAQLSQQGLGAGGEVSVSTSRRVEGGVTVQTTRRESRSSGQLAQQVMVLNGGRAGVRLAQSQPLQFYQVVWNGRGGASLLPSAVIVEAGRGFTVQPRWSGGDQPVLVDIAAESARLGDGGVRDASSTQTTVQLPLGEWVTIASSGDTQQTQERGLLSSREAAGSRRVLVQMRVSAP